MKPEARLFENSRNNELRVNWITHLTKVANVATFKRNGQKRELMKAKATRRDRNSVGIKDLKNKTSEIVQTVIRTKRAITIRKNSRAVAQIIPLKDDLISQLQESDLLSSAPTSQWKDLKLNAVDQSADAAIQAVIKDREDR